MYFIIAVLSVAALVALTILYYKIKRKRSSYDTNDGIIAACAAAWVMSIVFVAATVGCLAVYTTTSIQDDKCVVTDSKWEDQTGFITLCVDEPAVYDRWYIAPWLPKVEYTDWHWVKVPDTGQTQPWTHIQWDDEN